MHGDKNPAARDITSLGCEIMALFLASYARTRRTGKQQPGHDRASLLHAHAAVNRKNDLVDQFFDLERLPTRPQQIIDTLPISVGDGAVYSETRRRQFDPSAHGFYL